MHDSSKCLLAGLQPRPHSGRTAQRTDVWVQRHSSQGEEEALADTASMTAAGPAVRAAEQQPRALGRQPGQRQPGQQSSAVQTAVPAGGRSKTSLMRGDAIDLRLICIVHESA